jgi:hypothetical protein
MDLELKLEQKWLEPRLTNNRLPILVQVSENRPELGLIFKAKTRITNFLRMRPLLSNSWLQKDFDLGFLFFFENETFGLVLKSILWIESPWKLLMKHTIRCMKAWHLKHWTYIPVLSNSQDENPGIYQCWASTKPWFRTDPIFSWSSSKELVGYHVRCYLGWYPDFWISNFR